MKRFTLTALLTLVVSCVLANVYALTNSAEKTEAVRGKIEMDLPNTSAPKVQINLDKSFFNLIINFGIASIPKSDGDQPIAPVELMEYADMLKGAAVRAYDKEAEDLKQIIDHYQGALENEKWEHIVKVKDKFNLSLLYAEEPGMLEGIFATIIDDESWSFVNVYGEIDFQKLGVLFGRILESSSEDGISKAILDMVNAPNPGLLQVEINPETPEEASESETETSDEASKSETETNEHSK